MDIYFRWLATPIGMFLFAILCGWAITVFFKRIGQLVILLAFATLYTLSIPAASSYLMKQIQPYPALASSTLQTSNAQAIVVLGGGRNAFAPEYSGETVNAYSLERIRYAAAVQRVTQLPIITSGGSPYSTGKSEATLMREVLENEFRATVPWTENLSNNTFENAARTKELLDGQNIKKVLLITHAWHMPRAIEAFTSQGIEAIPAPTAFVGIIERPGVQRYLPNSSAHYTSSIALHEIIGRIWYRQHYYE